MIEGTLSETTQHKKEAASSCADYGAQQQRQTQHNTMQPTKRTQTQNKENQQAPARQLTEQSTRKTPMKEHNKQKTV